jgi:hypothetical protein
MDVENFDHEPLAIFTDLEEAINSVTIPNKSWKSFNYIDTTARIEIWEHSCNTFLSKSKMVWSCLYEDAEIYQEITWVKTIL